MCYFQYLIQICFNFCEWILKISLCHFLWKYIVKTVIGAPSEIFSRVLSIYSFGPWYIFYIQSIWNVSNNNLCGNGQVERFNGIIWNTVSLTLHSKGLPISQWEKQSVWSLLCTMTNATFHKRKFFQKRKCTPGIVLISWLSSPCKILMCNFFQKSKYYLLVEEVELWFDYQMEKRLQWTCNTSHQMETRNSTMKKTAWNRWLPQTALWSGQ